MDSYVDVKINEALYDMKEVLQNVEEQFSRVVQEKAMMETILKEKVQLIRVMFPILLIIICSYLNLYILRS